METVVPERYLPGYFVAFMVELPVVGGSACPSSAGAAPTGFGGSAGGGEAATGLVDNRVELARLAIVLKLPSATTVASFSVWAFAGFADCGGGEEAAKGLTEDRREAKELNMLLKTCSTLLAWVLSGFGGSVGGGEAAIGLADNRRAEANNRINAQNDIDFHLDLARTLKPFITSSPGLSAHFIYQPARLLERITH
jgi:hypothetical protein